MRHITKNNILILSTIISALVFAPVSSVYAAETKEETPAVQEADLNEAEEIPEEEAPTEMPEEKKSDEQESNRQHQLEEYGEYDGTDDYVTKTSKNDVNNAQLNFEVKVPDGFNLGVYLQVTNTASEKNYQLLATQENEFRSRLFVPAGHYEVRNVFVANDNVNQYPMEIPSDFDIAKDDVYIVTSTLLNYEEIEAEAQKRMGLVPEKEEEEPVKEEEPENKYDYYAVAPWRTFEHTGDSEAKIKLEGLCTEPIDLVVKITHTGAQKEGEFQYSTDGGTTWSDAIAITGKSVSVVTTDKGIKTGLSLSFDNSRYLINDEYRISCIREYEVNGEEVNGSGAIRLTSSDVIYNVGYDIAVKIASSGDVGEEGLTFKLSLDGGNKWSDPIPVPTDGVYNIPNTLLSLEFWTGRGKFLVGDTYNAAIKADMSQRNYIPYFIGAILIIGGAFFAIIYHFVSLKDKPGDYVLTPYTRIEIPKNRRLGKKK